MKHLIFLFFPLILFGQETTLIGDVDCDGQITSEDSSLILQYVTSTIDTLPCSENMNGLTPDQLQEIVEMLSEQSVNSFQQSISEIGPMYRYGDYPDFINVFNADTDYLYYFDAIRFCGQLSYNGYDDWFLASLAQLEEYIISDPGTINIPNMGEDDGAILTFWLKREPTFSTGYNSNQFVFQYFELSGPSHDTPDLMISSGGTSASYALSCFCVR